METLYNGITLPDQWPPREAYAQAGDDQMPVPYLREPPAIIPVDLGRQLFVDDFLVENSTLCRVFYSAVKYDGNPVMRPETDLERGENMPAAAPKSGGVWWDSSASCYRVWYDAGWFHKYAYATSVDGIVWNRHGALCEGGERPLPDFATNSSAAFIDFHESDPEKRIKMFIRQPDSAEGDNAWKGNEGRARAYVMSSADSVDWSQPVPTSPVGDRSTIFYNPFRRKWVYSIRTYSRNPFARIRHYRECADLIGQPLWDKDEEVFWTRADRLDPVDPAVGDPPQLYNLDAVGYESIMLGLFEIHLGPANNVCAQGGFPKIIDLKLGFSRDGFHWDRPDRSAFIASTRNAGDWDRGYVQSVGGCCLVYENELRFYYSGFMGDDTRKAEKEVWNCGMYANASTGMATLRRDGFASLEAGASGGIVTTRPLTFSGRYLFVNADTQNGELRVELLGLNGAPYKGYTAEKCVPVSRDTCKTRVVWQDSDSLPDLRGKPVRLRFCLTSGRIYSFWISGSSRGESGGYLAAGSPDYKGHQDC